MDTMSLSVCAESRTLSSTSNVNITVSDTAGQEVLKRVFSAPLQQCFLQEFERVRQLNYPLADVVLLCFSLVDPNSLHHAQVKWAPEIARNAPPDTPLILASAHENVTRVISAFLTGRHER